MGKENALPKGKIMDYNDIIKLVYDAKKIAISKKLKSKVSLKGKADYVTAVDLGISAYIKDGLKKIAPNVAFVTEEEDKHIESGERFILDPIDGTTNLVHGYKQSSISLAYYVNNKVEFGVVFSPFTYELFFAIKGKGAHFYSTRYGITNLLKIGIENYAKNLLKVSALSREDAIVEFGAGSTKKHLADENFAIAKEVFTSCLDIRRICSTALSICYIASGRIEGYFEKVIKVWDYAASSLILEEAGGYLSEWDGSALCYTKPSSIIAGNEDTYNYLLNLLKNK